MSQQDMITIKDMREAPKQPFHEFMCSLYPDMESAIEVYESMHGKKPPKVWHYVTENHKFERWLIPIEEVVIEQD